MLILTVTLGIFLSLGPFYVALTWEEKRAVAGFDRATDAIGGTIRKEIDINMALLRALNAFFESSRHVERSEFQAFTSELLRGNNSIQALAWIPRVRNDERSLYETRAREDGIPDFRITDRYRQGVMVGAADRSEYFPVYYCEPSCGNEMPIGYDLKGNLLQKRALELARDRGRMTATGPIILAQTEEGRHGFLIVAPLYVDQHTGNMPGTIEERRRLLQGFALGVFKIGNLVDSSQSHRSLIEDVPFILRDTVTDTVLYQRETAGRPLTAVERIIYAVHFRQSFQKEELISVAGRTWLIRYEAPPLYLAMHYTLVPFFVFCAGILVTIFMLYITATNIRRFEIVEELLIQRGIDLAQTNRSLRKEIEHRVTVETKLRKDCDALDMAVREQKEELAQAGKKLEEEIRNRNDSELEMRRKSLASRAIIDNIPDSIWFKDRSGELVMINQAYRSQLGLDWRQLIGKKDRDIWPDKLALGYMAEDEKILRTGMSKVFEREIPERDGESRWAEVIKRPVLNEHGEIIGTTGIARDITKQRQMTIELQRNYGLLQRLADMQNRFIEQTDSFSFYQELLDAYIDLTESQYGFIGEIVYTKGDVSHVQTYAMTDIAWNESAGTFSDRHRSSGLKFNTLDSLYGSVMTTGKVIIANDPGEDRRSCGLPDGHPELNTFLGIPFWGSERLMGIVALANRREGYSVDLVQSLSMLISTSEVMMAADRTKQRRRESEDERKRTLSRLRQAMRDIVRAMGRIIEVRDPYTAGHQRKVADLARVIAMEMDVSSAVIEGIHIAGLVHDIGKFAIPSEVLSKPGTLTKIETNMMRTHTGVGFNILKGIDFEHPIAETVFQHHERIDGSGYPRGLRGDEMLLESKILAVADTIEAMASHRPYRAALGIDAALKEISKNRGILYDPGVVDACIRLFREKGYDIKTGKVE